MGITRSLANTYKKTHTYECRRVVSNKHEQVHYGTIISLCPEHDSNLGQSRIAVFKDCNATTITTRPPWPVLHN